MNDNDIKELIESNENGSDWFNSYGGSRLFHI